MAFKCGNCNIEHSTRKEWLDHCLDVHKSPIYEGEERDVKYHNDVLSKRANAGDKGSKDLIDKAKLEVA